MSSTTATASPAPVSWTVPSNEVRSELVMRWLPTNGTSTRIPSRPQITDGTEASRRTTRIIVRRRRAGASSTMKIEQSTASGSASSTASEVISSVP